MNVTRIFHPVGQGAFYSEIFDLDNERKINIVYDCGSSIDLEIVKKEIRGLYDQNEQIEAVFISHLDSDHVNGLEYLLEYCNVKRLFLPMMTNEMKAMTIIRNLVTHTDSLDGTFVNDLIQNPQQTVGKVSDETQTVFIEPYQDDYDGGLNDSINIYLDQERNIQGKTFPSSIVINVSYMQWQWVPFNFRFSSRHADLRDALIDNGYSMPRDGEEALDMFSDPMDLDNLKNIIKNDITSSPNANSMTLYSGPDSQHIWFKSRVCNYSMSCRCHRYFDVYHIGCLYTGDYEAKGTQKWRDLERAYSTYNDRIGTLQIPHHGSYHNFNDKFISDFNAKYIISAGGKYRHPSASVLKKLMLSGRMVNVVTDDVRSRVVDSYRVEI